MVTKDLALVAREFTDGNGRTWRRNGQTKTWVRSPERFRVPVKFGLYDYGYVTELNASQFDVVIDKDVAFAISEATARGNPCICGAAWGEVKPNELHHVKGCDYAHFCNVEYDEALKADAAE